MIAHGQKKVPEHKRLDLIQGASGKLVEIISFRKESVKCWHLTCYSSKCPILYSFTEVHGQPSQIGLNSFHVAGVN